MSDKVYVGRKCQSFQNYGEYKPFSRVTMWTDDEHCYTAGDDTGRELSCECRSATQQIVDLALAQIKGYVYRPFEAKGCEIDPAAELGDAVTICGIYSVIGSMHKRYDALGLIDIAAPGGKEIDHKYPYKSKQERELLRRVKLEQLYYGAKISRREGLVIEKTDGENVTAKVVLNADELSFYNGEGGRVLYFDPTSGTYKFMGELNVNDKFVVDRFGNVTIKGNFNLANGTIYWGDNPPNKKRYAASIDGPWHNTMESGDNYCCDWDYKTNVWGEPYKFKGQDGRPGANGSDANVDFANILAALQKAASTQSTFITADEMGAPNIYGGNIYGAKMFANEFNVFPLDEREYMGAFNLYGMYRSSLNPYHFLRIAYQGSGFDTPEIAFGSPDGASAVWQFGATAFVGESLDFSSVNNIAWGSNTPTAKFG